MEVSKQIYNRFSLVDPAYVDAAAVIQEINNILDNHSYALGKSLTEKCATEISTELLVPLTSLNKRYIITSKFKDLTNEIKQFLISNH